MIFLLSYKRKYLYKSEITNIRDQGNTIMTQDERWMAKYNEVMDFIETNHRNPSRHRLEDHDMLNWMKATRKKMNAGELKEERVAMFKELIVIAEQYKRKNQYQ